MSVQETTKDVFDKETEHLSHYRKMANVISEEKRYLISDDKTKLGVILEGKNKKFWGYVLLIKDGKGKFEFEDAKATFKTSEEAEQALKEKMIK
jgi:hypothetical protein